MFGQYGSDFLFRNATIQDRNPDMIKLPVIDGNSLVYVRWIVSGAGQGEIVLDTIKGGQSNSAISVVNPTP